MSEEYTNKLRCLYDYIWASSLSYNNNHGKEPHTIKKDNFIKDRFSNITPLSIIDAGCGRGFYSRLLKDLGHRVIPLDISEVCLEKYVGDFEYICSDLVTYFDKPNLKYDCIFCVDVLEHLFPDQVEKVLESFSRSCDFVFLGIATIPSYYDKKDIHYTKKPANEWSEMASKYFTNVNIPLSLGGGSFFFLEGKM
jgi:SAM-dependent methyltransferase